MLEPQVHQATSTEIRSFDGCLRGVRELGVCSGVSNEEKPQFDANGRSAPAGTGRQLLRYCSEFSEKLSCAPKHHSILYVIILQDWPAVCEGASIATSRTVTAAVQNTTFHPTWNGPT